MSAFPTLRLTAWRNPTSKVIKVDLFSGPTRDNPGGRIHVEWQPGETQEVPSEYDAAIRKVRDGKVVGGLAPQLVRADKKPIPLDPAIDAEAAERKAARDSLRDAQALEQAAKIQLAEAAHKVAAVKKEEPAPVAESEPRREPERGQQNRR